MEVVQHHHDRPLGRQFSEQRGHCLEQAIPLLLGAAPRPGLHPAQRQEPGQFRILRAHAGALLEGAVCQPALNRLRERAVRPAPFRVVAGAPQHGRPLFGGPAGRLGNEARLAEAGLAGDEEDRRVLDLQQLGQHVIPAAQRQGGW
jgi:hypothetical protein